MCSFDDICINSTIGKHYHNVDSSLLAHLCLKHIIFYRIVSDEVRIIRVLHQSMDFEQHLN
ncbi:MAG: type II toxin-antitoxin system RelE/ParE family toxin [Mariprofundaceae bacterium]|nr:type II toxin-antitoxin system RelE/ParE family toxin [Mariprofundaceae bacterium]